MICQQVVNYSQIDIDLFLQIIGMKKNIHLHQTTNYSLTLNLSPKKLY